jgi:hypothetical protein
MMMVKYQLAKSMPPTSPGRFVNQQPLILRRFSGLVAGVVLGGMFHGCSDLLTTALLVQVRAQEKGGAALGLQGGVRFPGVSGETQVRGADRRTAPQGIRPS